MLSIKSSSSNRELVLSNYSDGHFLVELKGEVTASTRVWADEYVTLPTELFQKLAEFKMPWSGQESWESLEGELHISATCSPLGEVRLQIKLWARPGEPEEWRVQAGLVTELGQLQNIAKSAAALFREPSA